MTKIWILLLLLIPSIVYAQQFTGGFVDFGPNYANQIYTDTSKFTGPGLSASETTVQSALDRLNGSSGVTVIVDCETTDDYCFVFSNDTLALWVGGTKQVQWPSVVTQDFLLLESGDFLLLETGDKIVLE